MIADAAIAKSEAEADPSFPPGFVPALPRLAGGLRVRMTGYGLDLAVSDALAAALGWREGMNVSMGASACGRMLAVSRGGRGATLVRDASDPGCLGIDRDLSGVPLGVPLAETGWLQPEYQVDGASLVIAIPSPVSARAQQPSLEASVPEIPADATVRSRQHWSAAAACIASAAAGFLAAIIWL